MREKIKEHKYFQLGMMILIVVLVSICLLAVVLNLEAAGRIVKRIGDVFSPLVLGLVFAYLMNPLMNFMNKRLKPFFPEEEHDRKEGIYLEPESQRHVCHCLLHHSGL